MSTDPTVASDAFLHEASDTVRFVVPVGGALVNASINRPALRHCFGETDATQDLLTIYGAHAHRIHEVVCQRLAQGAREPVMLREAHFTPS